MSDKTWPIEHPDRIQLYSLATPWVGCLDWGYGAREDLKLDAGFPKFVVWYTRCTEKPASVRSAKVCAFSDD